MLIVQKGKDGPQVEVPRSVAHVQKGRGIDDYVKAWKEGTDPLEGVPFQDAKARAAMAKAGLGAWSLDGRAPSGEKGYTMADVQPLLPPLEEAQPPETGEEE